jgi:hypothetical protein
MPQLDKVMFMYIFFGFFVISIIVYSIFYLYCLLPLINQQKVRLINYFTKLSYLNIKF